ncbi:hypothetical protein GCM10008941_31520 [Rhizomicrobium palustre]
MGGCLNDGIELAAGDQKTSEDAGKQYDNPDDLKHLVPPVDRSPVLEQSP